MAYRQNIPEAWKKLRPNSAKLPYIYNLDAPVGMGGSPNQKLDVMLVQVLLQHWATDVIGQSVHRVDPKSLPQGPLPPTGTFDNRTLAWILLYQMTNWRDTSLITGKVTPAASDGSDLNGKHTLLYVELQLLAPHGNGTFSKWFLDMSTDPTVPPELVQALKTAK